MAMLIYQERYPNHIIPDARTFYRIHRILGETGSIRNNNSSKGLHRLVRTPALEEQPETSTKEIAETLNVSDFLIWKIIVNHLL